MSVIDTSPSVSNMTRKSGLDEIFFQEYEMEKQPGEVRADDPLFFVQGSTSWGFIQGAEYKGPGNYDVVDEEEEVPDSTIKVSNKYTSEVFEYDKDVGIPQRYQEDSEMYGVVNEMVQDMGVRGRTSRDRYAMENSWGNPFDATNNPTPDGAAFGSNSHVLLSGDSFDNLETGAASADNVKILVRKLRLQKAHDGDLASYHADAMLSPVILHPTLTEITKSELEAGTTDNQLNYFSQIYPGMVVGASEYLDSAFNTLNSNANTTYFALSRRHCVKRSVRVALGTDYVPPELSRKRTAYYRARFRERTYFKGSGLGVETSNGTA